MKTFKNKKFIKRDYESQNCVFIQAQNKPSEHWEECNEKEIEKMRCTQLYKQTENNNTAIYFGYL